MHGQLSRAATCSICVDLPVQRRVRGEHVGFVEVGRALVRLGEGGHLPVDIDPEGFAHVDGGVGRGEDGLGGSVEALVGHIVHRVWRGSGMDR